jgi:hypothetical protein
MRSTTQRLAGANPRKDVALSGTEETLLALPSTPSRSHRWTVPAATPSSLADPRGHREPASSAPQGFCSCHEASPRSPS